MKKEKRIFALGFFDGVHLGHQALLRQCSALAGELGCQTAAITFDKHPMSLFLPDTPPLINTTEDRKTLLRQFGMDSVREYPVAKDVMSTNWQDFLEELLLCGAAGFVCGHDFRFGHRGQGDAAGLQAFCAQRGLPCIVVPEQTMDGIRISSTYIRSQIQAGDMATAVKFLGHPHILSGQVVAGHQLGRTLGIPTANLAFPEGLTVPKFGVYACLAHTQDRVLPAVTNIGVRPTVGGSGITVEPWILDFSADLYGKTITLEFYKFLRPEQKFGSLEELQGEIRKNAAETRKFFGKK